MIKNWRITAFLQSPLCGQAPQLDALLAWELSLRLGEKYQRKITRSVPLSEMPKIPLPLARRTICNYDIFCCSDPILPSSRIEWQERMAKRFDTTKNSLILHESQLKSLLIASGPYKQRFSPVNLKLIDRVVWIARGDRKQINKLLKGVSSIGKCRNSGYGLVGFFDYEELEDDLSIFANYGRGKILMRTVPSVVAFKEPCTGYSVSFGAWTHPYWHPENYMEVAIPC